MKTIEQNILNFIRRNNLINPADKILLGLSGGPDSVFAFHFLIKFAKLLSIELFAVHINHNLRNEQSGFDESFCRNVCKKNSVDIKVFNEDVKGFAAKNKLSIEEAARDIRYKNFKLSAKEFGCNKIITAHNKNDNAETVLLNLINGTGLKGLTGIPVKRENIIRPFLSTTKPEIINYLHENNIEFRIDKTNDENDYSRNFLRNKIIPQVMEKFNPQLPESLLRMSELINIAEDINKSYYENWKVRSLTYSGEKLFVKIENNSDADKISYMGKYYLKDYFSYESDFNDYTKISSLIHKQKGTSEQLGDGICVYREATQLVFLQDISEPFSESEYRIGDELKIGTISLKSEFVSEYQELINSNKLEELISADKLEDLKVRAWKAGDKFIPLGMAGEKNVSDFLTDQKIPSWQRRYQLVLTNNDEIVWLIGMRIDDKYKINEHTKRYCKLWIK